MSSKHFYFIRHGQSEANGAQVFQGADAALTELGRRQAEYVADRMRHVSAEVILASPMTRALETARAVERAMGIPLEVVDSLREYVPPSKLIGVPQESPEGKAYLAELLAHHGEPGWRYADEDTYFDLHARAVEVLAYLIARPEERVVVVSHAGFMRVMLTAMLSEGEADARTAARLARFLDPMNTGVSMLRYDPHEEFRNKWRLVTWNDHAHLADTRVPEPDGNDE